MSTMDTIKQWADYIKKQNEIKSEKIDDVFIPEVVFNLIFYTQQFRFRNYSDYYDIAILAILDIFIAYQMT